MKLFIKKLALVCGISSSLFCVELTIDQPGIYELGQSLTSLPVAADQIIVIASSDVVFDLGEFVVSQGNVVAAVDGILINPNLSDIVIRNGMIRGVTQTAISISSGASRILIENMKVDQCARGILATSVTDLTIQGCQFTRCSNASLISLLDFIGSSRILLSDILISDANYPSSRMLFANSISACTIQRMKIYSSATFVGEGIRIQTTENMLFSDVVISSCTNTSYFQIGGLNNILKNVIYISSNVGNVTVFTLDSASLNNLILQTIVLGITACSAAM
ncbi:MAG: right-handed parallel beta-helix repeat-containing protein, partial [Cyanobacteria bacterium]|nr:right-handed parallel beta-helix repeat-containing protein [Cyanobacteriota bacterium]